MATTKSSGTKDPKWDSGVAVAKGKQSVSLTEAYKSELSPRIAEEESEQHAANVTELEQRLKKQGTNLSGQKSTTAAQNQTIKQVNKRVVSLKQIVVGANASMEIKNAYGVGSRVVLTVNGVSSAANTIITAYKQFTAWSNSAGIIQKDIDELVALEKALYSADTTQGMSIYARKAATMDKNTLQRAVEDGVTKISSLGVHEFEISNPSAAKLFADLIPGSTPKPKSSAAKATPPAA